MTGDSIFSALARYNSATDENYLTECFVFLLNSLLEKERTIGIQILNQLCVKDNEFCFDADEAISVSTQDVTEEGTPDIRISSPNKLIYVEVKHDSPLSYQQIERYKKALESSDAAVKHVVLLTRFAIDFEKEDERPYKHVYWRDVYKLLESTHAEDPVIVYLIDSFKSFLEVKQMAIQKVGWEYINGMPAFNNLISMIEAALQSAKIPIYRNSTGWDYKGFLLENQEFWCGIVYDEPEVIRFQITDRKGFAAMLEAGDEIEYLVSEAKDKRSIFVDLSLEDIHFFSLDKDKQLEEITRFVKTSFAGAQKMRIKTKPRSKVIKPDKK